MQHLRDFPGGPVVKNLPCNAEVVGSLLGQGTKIPHAEEQLSLCTTMRDSMHHNKILMHHKKKLHDAVKILCATIKMQHTQIHEYF